RCRRSIRETRVPGAAQRERSETLRCRPGTPLSVLSKRGPGSASHHFALARAAPHPGHAARNSLESLSMRSNDGTRTGGEILIDQLVVHGVRHAFCVPGESYLAALDAFYGTDIKLTICRHESAAAMAAESIGKVTGRPGICFVTRGPGATNAS